MTLSRRRFVLAAPVSCAALLAALFQAGVHDSRPGPGAFVLHAQQPATAESVARQIQDRNTGRDSQSSMRMKLYDRHNRVRERALAIVSLRGREAPGAAPTAPDGDRLLIRFNYPNDIRGTGFLVWEHPKVDDERFLYLPSLGRVRRIAGAETQESFVGSDFTYAFAGPDPPWTAPAGGPPRDAWRLESRRKDASAEFPRVVSIVLKDSFVVVGAEVYNRRNEKQKIYTVRRLQQIEGIWTIMESEMTDAVAKTRTELVVEATDYNVGLKESDFSRRELERVK